MNPLCCLNTKTSSKLLLFNCFGDHLLQFCLATILVNVVNLVPIAQPPGKSELKITETEIYNTLSLLGVLYYVDKNAGVTCSL